MLIVGGGPKPTGLLPTDVVIGVGATGKNLLNSLFSRG
jgi:hypothetical protein